MAFCEKCGASLPEGTRFCQKCGQPVSTPDTGASAGYTAPQQPQQNNAAPDYGQGYQQQGYQQGGYAQGYQQGYQQQGGYQQGGYGYQQGGYQPGYGGGYQPPVPPSGVTVGNIYRKCFKFIGGKPTLLIGLSLMGLLLNILATIFGILPIIVIPVTLALEVGMASVFLDGYRGKEINSDQLFKGFKGFSRFAGGMAWRKLWLYIWSLVSTAGILIGLVFVVSAIGTSLSSFISNYIGRLFGGYGFGYGYGYGYGGSGKGAVAMIVLGIIIMVIIGVAGLAIRAIKGYSYRFVPYILLNDPNINATEALRVSMRLTNGYKGKMFLADLLLAIGYIVCWFIFYLLAKIGAFFVVIQIIADIILFIVYYLASGILKAAFYDEIEKEKK
jgi:uncharacterized membrane protein